MQMYRGIYLLTLLLLAQSAPAQLIWTALNGPAGLISQKPSLSASGIIFLNRRNLNQFDISFDLGSSWEAHDLPPFTFPYSYKVLQLPNDQTYVLLSDCLYAFRQSTRSWEILPGFDGSKQAWFDSQNRIWRLLGDGQLAYSVNEGKDFATARTDVATNALLAMYNNQHNLLVEPDAPQYRLYHFSVGGPKQLIPFNINNFNIEWVKYNPYSGTAYLKTNEFKAYLKKSTDGGITWSTVQFPPDYPVEYVSDMLFTQNGETWALTNASAMISTNEGNTWTPLPLPAPKAFYPVSTIDVSANGQKIIYYAGNCGEQGFYRSTDRGAIWTDLSATLRYPTISNLLKTSTGTLYAEACRTFNVDVSHDEGQSWQTLVISGPKGPFSPVSVCKAPNGTLFAPGDQVVYRSKNNGASWEALDFGIFPVIPYHRMNAGPDGSIYLFHHQQGGGYSMDNGESWIPLSGFGQGMYAREHFHPNGNAYHAEQSFIFKFTPGANETELIASPDGSSIDAFAISSSGRLLIITTNLPFLTKTLYFSDDEGQSFQTGNPLPEWSSQLGLISGPNMLLLRAGGNYYRSLDDGLHWELYFMGSDLPARVSCFYFSPDHYLYAGLENTVIHRSSQKIVSAPEPLPHRTFIKGYPNPVTDVLWLESSVAGVVQYTVCDALGRVMLRQHAPAGARETLAVDVSSLHNGVYFIELYDEEGGLIGHHTFCKQ